MVDLSKISNILVFSNGELLGDGLVKLPFLWQLKANFPNAHITWLTRNSCVYENILLDITKPILNEVITNTRLGSHLKHLIFGGDFFDPKINKKYDLIINTEPRLMRTLAAWRLKHQYFYSAHKNFALSDFKAFLPQPTNPNQVLQNLLWHLSNIVKKEISYVWKEINIPQEYLDWAKFYLPHSYKINYIGIAPGSGGRHKCWPVENYIDFGNLIKKIPNYQPVYLIGPQELEWYEAIKKNVSGAIFPLQACQKTHVFHTIALSKLLKFGIGNDAGGAHLMAAAQIPLVILYGPTPPDYFVPNTPIFFPLELKDFNATSLNQISPSMVLEKLLHLKLIRYGN